MNAFCLSSCFEKFVYDNWVSEDFILHKENFIFAEDNGENLCFEEFCMFLWVAFYIAMMTDDFHVQRFKKASKQVFVEFYFVWFSLE